MEKQFKQWYEYKARTYADTDPADLRRYEIALKHAPVSSGHNVVDLGCKTGSLISILDSRTIKCNYCGLDIAEEAVKKIKSRPGVRIVVHDIMERFPIEDNWADRVFCLEVLEHVKQPVFALQEITRILKPDGVAVVSVPNPYYWVNIFTELFKIPENEGHISSFRWAEMMTLSDFAGLKLVKVRMTFDRFPPMKVKRHLFIKAVCTFNSSCNLYVLIKK